MNQEVEFLFTGKGKTLSCDLTEVLKILKEINRGWEKQIIHMSEVLTKLSRDHHLRIRNENTKDLGQHIFFLTKSIKSRLPGFNQVSAQMSYTSSLPNISTQWCAGKCLQPDLWGEYVCMYICTYVHHKFYWYKRCISHNLEIKITNSLFFVINYV